MNEHDRDYARQRQREQNEQWARDHSHWRIPPHKKPGLPLWFYLGAIAWAWVLYWAFHTDG